MISRDKDNHISCRWSKEEQRYITLAEDWEKTHMTWNDLLKLLENMKAVKHSCMDTQVQAYINGEVHDVDMYESLTSGDVLLTGLLVDVSGE